MKRCKHQMSYTSNDLLATLASEPDKTALNYGVVAQNAEEVQDIQNAPSISIGPYLLASGQMKMVTANQYLCSARR